MALYAVQYAGTRVEMRREGLVRDGRRQAMVAARVRVWQPAASEIRCLAEEQHADMHHDCPACSRQALRWQVRGVR